MAIPIDALIEQMRKEAELTDSAAPSEIPAIDPKNVVQSLLKRKAALEKQREDIISQQEESQRQALEKLQAPAPAAMPMGVPQLPSFALGEKPLPRTYEALQAADKRLEELSKKMALPKEEPNLLAEALLAGIPTILGAGIGAAIGKPGMFGAGLAAGATGGAEAIKGMKAAEKETRAAQQKAAEEKLQRQTTLEKSYLDAVAKAENYPYEAALIVAKSASPEFSKQAIEQMRANLKLLLEQAKGTPQENKLKGAEAELNRIQQQLYPHLQPPKGAGKPKEPTATQFAAGGYVKRMEQAEAVFEKLQKSGYKREDVSEAARSMVGRLIPGVMTPAAQQQVQAERNFLTAVLRRESGAAISSSEMASGEAQYFDRVGDSPEVKAQKKANREQAIQNLRAEAGEAYKRIPLVAPEAPAPQGDTSQRLEAVRKRIAELEAKKGKK